MNSYMFHSEVQITNFHIPMPTKTVQNIVMYELSKQRLPAPALPDYAGVNYPSV